MVPARGASLEVRIMALVKCLVRSAVIAGLVGGAAVVVAGPDRIGALVHQTRDGVCQAIDQHIDDPIALRAQLRDLESQYPARIAEVRGDLGELREQISQLNRDQTVAQRVVELSSADLGTLQSMIAKAESVAGDFNVALQTSDAATAPAIVRVAFNGESMNLDQAYGKANRIQQVQQAYAQRIEDAQRDMGYLTQQETRLSELLAQLEQEQASFQTQLFQLDRQVDAIARNDRLIEVMEKRQATIDNHSRYRAHSLEQVQGRFAEIRSKQESRLESLGNRQSTTNYEDRARFDLDARNKYSGVKAPAAKPAIPTPTVIEITPSDVRKDGAKPASSSVVMNNR